MKFTKIVALICFVVLSSVSVKAQTRDDVFSGAAKVTWLGLDFSNTRFIGRPNARIMGIGKRDNNGDITPEEFRDVYIPGWARLFINEPKKYDLAKATHRSSVDYAMNVTEAVNRKLNTATLFTDNPGDFNLIDEAKVASMVKKYDLPKKEGVGLVFIISGMSKGFEKAGIWVTFVSLKDKSVLFTKYMEGKPGGFGIRNYWAHTFNDVLKDMDKDFTKWR